MDAGRHGRQTVRLEVSSQGKSCCAFKHQAANSQETTDWLHKCCCMDRCWHALLAFSLASLTCLFMPNSCIDMSLHRYQLNMR